MNSPFVYFVLTLIAVGLVVFKNRSAIQPVSSTTTSPQPSLDRQLADELLREAALAPVVTEPKKSYFRAPALEGKRVSKHSFVGWLDGTTAQKYRIVGEVRDGHARVRRFGVPLAQVTYCRLES